MTTLRRWRDSGGTRRTDVNGGKKEKKKMNVLKRHRPTATLAADQANNGVRVELYDLE